MSKSFILELGFETPEARAKARAKRAEREAAEALAADNQQVLWILFRAAADAVPHVLRDNKARIWELRPAVEEAYTVAGFDVSALADAAAEALADACPDADFDQIKPAIAAAMSEALQAEADRRVA